MKENKSSEHASFPYGWIFLGLVSLLYLVLSFTNPPLVHASLQRFISLLVKMIPALVGVFSLIFLINLFFHPRSVKKHLGKESGWRGLLFAMIAGIISTGPIYVWYPLLADLQRKGMRIMLITVFLYNRAVKIPMIPLMIYYFGLKFTVVLTLVMVGASILEGWLVEQLVPALPEGTAHE